MKENELIEKVSTDIYKLMDHFCLHPELEEPFREFDMEHLEGSYAEGPVGLISHICFVNGYYQKILTEDQYKIVASLHYEDNFVPNFDDEEIFGDMEIDFANVENEIILNIARYAKLKNDPVNFPTDSFEEYFNDYQDDAGLAIFK